MKDAGAWLPSRGQTFCQPQLFALLDLPEKTGVLWVWQSGDPWGLCRRGGGEAGRASRPGPGQPADWGEGLVRACLRAPPPANLFLLALGEEACPCSGAEWGRAPKWGDMLVQAQGCWAVWQACPWAPLPMEPRPGSGRGRKWTRASVTRSPTLSQPPCQHWGVSRAHLLHAHYSMLLLWAPGV